MGVVMRGSVCMLSEEISGRSAARQGAAFMKHTRNLS